MGWRCFAPGAAAAAFAFSMLPGAMAYAQSAPESDKVAAETLFEDGRRLAEAGKYPEACPKFADSQKLDPSAATLLNLANCLEKLGRTATSWATFKQAGSLATAVARNDYVATADRRANALFAKLARLIVSVPHALVGLVVKRDNAVLEHSEWGNPIPIDAGSHVLTATAPGYASWVSAVDIAQDGIEVSVVVPQLEALPAPRYAPAAPPSTEKAATPTPDVAVAVTNPTPGPSRSADSRHVIGLVVGSAGLASVGVGVVFSAVALSKYHALQSATASACEWDNQTVCNPQMLPQLSAERDDERTAGAAATWTLGLGAAALIAGAAIWITAPSGAKEHESQGSGWVVLPTLGGALVRGAW
jgi:hypothetical protein